MSSPRELRLERLGERDGRRPTHLGAVARIDLSLEASSTPEFRLSYEALIDAVFTAPGAIEWLSSLRRTVAAMLADKNSAPRDAIHTAPVSGGPGDRPRTSVAISRIVAESL